MGDDVDRLRFIFVKRHVHVKPLDATLFSMTQIVVAHNLAESFVDDRRRYGWRLRCRT